MKDPNAFININRLPIFGMRAIDINFLKDPLWIRWLETINKNGGIYEWRWGDDDIYTLFSLISNTKIIDYNKIEGNCFNTQKIIFKQVPYKSPENVREEDMFYNKKDNSYARNRFSVHRKGYLHMLNFKCNMLNYENTNFHNYKYVLLLDDEAGFTKEINFDPFQILCDNKVSMGSFYTQERERQPSSGQIDTTVGLWDFTKQFIKENDIKITSKHIQNLMKDPNAFININRLPIFGMRAIDINFLKDPLWIRWLETINKNGGIYEWRWGDDDIYTLFSLISNTKIIDYNKIEGNCFNTQKFRSIEGYAPTVKDKRK